MLFRSVVTKLASSSCEGIFLLQVVERRQVKFLIVDVNQLIKSNEENDMKNCLLALRFCWLGVYSDVRSGILLKMPATSQDE